MNNYMTLSDAVWRSGSLLRQIVLVIAGIAILTAAAKIKFPVPPSPVPVTMGTFAVLVLGAAYGPRLGLATILGYLLLGALGLAVFSGDKAGLTYLMGGTGGFLAGFVLATLILGIAATKGWDRSIWKMALALLAANVAIYVPGLLWLNQFADGWAQTFTWGITPFLIGDMMKLALAALLLPAAWAIVKRIKG